MVRLTPMLGWHWMIDAADCDAAKLEDPVLLAALLERVPDALKLTRVGTPQILDREEPGTERSLAGVVLIAESHFSLHLRPASRSLHADLFSCARFDGAPARALLQEAYGFTSFEESMLSRGAGR